MKVDILKKLIKQAVKEAIQEEIKEILVEAIKAPKAPATAGGYGQVTETVMHKADPTEMRAKYSDLVGGMERGKTDFSFNSSHVGNFGNAQTYRPPASANTAGEGSSLPAGEVSLDQIMGLMSK